MLTVEKRHGWDIPFTIAVFALAAVGLVAVYSASNYSAAKDYGDAFYFVRKQAVGLLLGACAFVLAGAVDYRRWKKWGFPLLIISLIMLALVFVPGIGTEKYGAKRWIKLGFLTIQPSDIAKIAYIFFAAAYVSASPDAVKSFKGVLPLVLSGGAVCALILLEPNMSITVCVALLMLAIIFASGAKLRHIALLIAPCAALVPVLIIAEPYRLKRLSAFLDPWASPKGEGYQLLQSLYALGSGGWFGVGLFNSRQKFEFLPFAESDFILSVIGEETGAVGMALLFALMFFVIYRGFRTAARASDIYGYMLAFGITAIYAVQVIVNIAVVTGSIPPTGLPLPLISSGNTSIIVFMFALGILNSVNARGTDI